MKSSTRFFLSAFLLVLSSCSQDATVDEVSGAATSPFNADGTVKDLMTSLIVPNAERIWGAVSYVANPEGVTETEPQTDEDWASLRASALALVEAGNLLMIPGRKVDLPENAASYADFQNTPAEIERLIAAYPGLWTGYLQDMQVHTLQTLEAIEARDTLKLIERGARINEACEDCHSRFWYRPVPMPGWEGLR